MPTIRVDTGGGAFNIDVPNFATEETLSKLLDAMDKDNTNRGKGRKAEQAEIKSSTQSLSDFGDQIDLTSDEIERSGGQLGATFNRAGDKIANVIDRMKYGFEDLTGNTSESGRALEKTTSTFADLASKALDGIDSMLGGLGGPITSAVSGLITGAGKVVLQLGSALVGFYVGQMEGLRAQQRDFYDSGVFFTNGIDTAAQIAGAAGITLGDLAAASKDAKEALRFMSGSSAGGLGAVSKAFGGFTRQQRENLYALGYTNEEMLTQLADLGSAAGEVGKQMDMAELEKQSYGYLQNIKTLSKLTGEDAKAARARREAMRTDAQYQTLLRRLQPQQAEALKEFVTYTDKFGPEFANAAKRILTGAVPTQELAQMRLMFPEAMAQVERFRQGLLDGTVTQNDVAAAITNLGTAANKEGTIVADRFGSMAGAGSEFIDNVTTTAGLFTAAGQDVKNASANLADGLDPQGDINKGIAKFVDINTRMNNALQQAALSVTGQMAPIIDNVVEGLVKLAQSLPGGVNAATQAQMDTATVNRLAASLTEVGQSQTFGSTSDQGRALRQMSDEQLAAMGLERTRRVMQGGPRSGGAVSYEVKRTRAAQPQNQALGGIIPHMDPEGTLIRAGEKQNEAIVPLPDGRTIPVKLDDAAFRSMNDKLDLLARINGAMLTAMENNNRLTRQGIQLAS